MPETPEGRMAELPLSLIDIGVRARKAYNNIPDLWASIAEKGLIHPIAVYERNPDDYLLLAGGRRYAAHVHGGAETIKARIYTNPLTELEIRDIELSENLDRENLTWQETVNLKKQIHDLRVQQHGQAIAGISGGHTLEDTAEELGESRTLLAEDIKLAEALEEHPEISVAPDKTSAKRLLQRIQRQAASMKALEAHKTTLATSGDEKYKQTLIDSYIIGDFFEKVRTLPAHSYDLVEVDPPYGIDLIKTRKNRTNRGSLEDYHEVPAEEYADFVAQVITECYRVLADPGWMIFWHATQWQATILPLIQKSRFSVFHVPAIWQKLSAPGQSQQPKRILGSTYEPFFYARKGDANLFKPGRSNTFAFKIVSPMHKIHPAERPVELLVELLQVFSPPGGRVLVPFAGSGNTLLACSNTGRRGLAIDLQQTYKNDFAARVLDGRPMHYTSYPE